MGREESGVSDGAMNFFLADAEKRITLEEYLQRRDRYTYDRYRAQRAMVKQEVKFVASGDGESCRGMISRETKNIFEKGKANEEG